MTQPAALYIRVSSEVQARDDRYGLERQEVEARAYAARLGLVVGETYSDTISGRTETRRGLEELKASRSKFSAVITSEADRLGRTPLAGHRIMAELIEAGFAVHSAMDGLYDPNDDSSALTFDMRMVIAHSELRSIKRRMLGGKLARAEKGGVIPHGWRCYGYRTVWAATEGKPVRSIEVDAEQAPVVREVFARLAAGESTQLIADDLNRRNIPTLAGKAWLSGRVWYMAQNRAYMGEVTMNLKHVGREFTFTVPALTDPTTWEVANGSLKRKPRLSLDVHPLNGLLFCSDCGGAMSGTNKVQSGRTYSHYRCTRAWKHQHYGPARCGHAKHHRAEDLHHAAEAAVRHLALYPEAYIHQQIAAPTADPARERAVKEVARLEALLIRYRADYSRGLLDAEEYAPMRDEARQQLAVAQAAAVTIPMPVRRDPTATLELIADLVAQERPWREVLAQSGTRLRVSMNGMIEVELRV